MRKNFNYLNFFIASIIILSFWLWPTYYSRAETVEQLKQNISNFEAERNKLDAEIKAIKLKLSTTQTQSKSLKAELARIEATRQALNKQIELTQNQIGKANLVINKLSSEISTKKTQIGDYQTMISSAIRNLRSSEEESLTNIVLSIDTLSTFGAEVANIDNIQGKLQTALVKITGAKKELEVKKVGKELEKNTLVSLKSQLADEKKIADINKKNKDELLTQTKSKESNYQKQLAASLKKKLEVESEMNKAEESLRIAINPSLLPKTGSGALAWPLGSVKITQTFGYTTFALQNSAVYGGKGHNGIDLGASVGSKLMAARGGTIIGAGDTDVTCKGASYGKWILIKHDNGLSSLYAHLSLIKVAEGQAVATGETIGYTGNTGYSTGPHLHFSVYASQGVQVGSLKSQVAGCGTYRLPLASPNSYLNPLSYLKK